MQEQVDTVQKIINMMTEFAVKYSLDVLGALIILFIGFLVAKWFSRVLLKMCEKKKLDVTLSHFIASTGNIIVFAFAVIIALGKFGITIAPFVAALSAAAFGASFAIQGPLSNYGAGLSIILSRPFVVGDTITVKGVSGVVQEVKLAATTLTDEDGIKITIPNKHVVGEIIHNSKEKKVVESMVGISYGSNPEAAIKVVKDILKQTPEVADSPLPWVGIQDFGDSSINIGYRYWVPTVKFFQISGAVNLAVFKALQTANITIPFPQRDIHIVSQTANLPQ